MKKCVLVNCFASSNEMRVEPIRDYIKTRGYETIYLASDFHHAKKEYIQLEDDITPIHTKPYRKNISFGRLYSHYDFTNQVYNKLCFYKPDLIYIKFPPNALVKMVFNYKAKYNCKVLLDLFDLWPESLPLPDIIKQIISPGCFLWASLRNKYLKCADLLFTECYMYQLALRDYLPNNVGTLYLMKEDIKYNFYKKNDFNTVKLCYLGGINNLVDLLMVGKIIKTISKKQKVQFHIIGDGINRDKIISVAKESGALVTFHGIIYDEEKKYNIMSKCDFGINIMKKNIKVALTIKSIEYFRAGLGILNNIPYDTWDIINTYHAGINIMNGDFKLSVEDIDSYRKGARKAYESLFTRTAFLQKLAFYFDEYIDMEG